MLNELLETAIRAYNGTSMVPEKRGQDFVSYYGCQLREDLKTFEDELEKERYETSYTSLITKWLHAKSNCMSSMITGPANFPVERNRKRLDSEQKAGERFFNWREKVLRKLNKPENTDIVKGSEGAVDQLKERLTALESLQEIMKLTNKLIRSKRLTEEEKIERFLEVKPSCTDEQILEHLNSGGYPSYRLTNNNAKINTAKRNIASEEKRLAAYTKGNKEYSIGDIDVIENVDDNRLQLSFDGKPSDEIRKELKMNGFKWSPKNEVWQRQLTNNALVALKYLSFYKESNR